MTKLKGENGRPTSPTYRNPPVVERAIRVTAASLPRQQYDERVDSWREQMAPATKHHEQQYLVDYSIDSERPTGPPVVTQRGEVNVRDRFFLDWPRAKAKQVVQTLYPALIVNVRRTAEAVGSYRDLVGFLEVTLAKWRQHFGVEALSGLQLEYWNLLGPRFTDAFVVERVLRMERLLTCFVREPLYAPPGSQGAVLLPPYRMAVRSKVEIDGRPYITQVQLEDAPEADQQPSVRLHLRVAAESPLPPTAEGCQQALTVTHDLIIGSFEALFTEEAKQAFKGG